MDLPTVFPAASVQTLIQILRDNALETKRRTAFQCAWELAGWVGGTFLRDESIIRFTYSASEDWDSLIVTYMVQVTAAIQQCTPVARNEPMLFDVAVTSAAIDWVSCARIINSLILFLTESE